MPFLCKNQVLKVMPSEQLTIKASSLPQNVGRPFDIWIYKNRNYSEEHLQKLRFSRFRWAANTDFTKNSCLWASSYIYFCERCSPEQLQKNLKKV